MQLALGVRNLPVPHEVTVDQAPQAHRAGVLVGNLVAQQVAGLHAHDRALNHAHVVLADTAGVGDGCEQGEAVVLVTQGLDALRVGEGGNNVLGHDAEAAVGIGERAIDLPETGLYGDGTELLTLVVEEERFGAVLNEGQAILLKGNNLAEGGVFLTLVPHGSGAFPGAEEPRKGNEFRG